jgi:hypothetical protein
MTEGRPHYGTQRDANQADIKGGLEQLGFVALDVSQLAPLGFDLLVCGWHGLRRRVEWLAVEVKTEGGTLTRREKEFFADMRQRFDDPPIIVARDLMDILSWYARAV